MTKEQFKREIIELFCGVGNGEVDCTLEAEMKLDEIFERFVSSNEENEVKEIMRIIDGRHLLNNI